MFSLSSEGEWLRWSTAGRGLCSLESVGALTLGLDAKETGGRDKTKKWRLSVRKQNVKGLIGNISDDLLADVEGNIQNVFTSV